MIDRRSREGVDPKVPCKGELKDQEVPALEIADRCGASPADRVNIVVAGRAAETLGGKAAPAPSILLAKRPSVHAGGVVSPRSMLLGSPREWQCVYRVRSKKAVASDGNIVEVLRGLRVAQLA